MLDIGAGWGRWLVAGDAKGYIPIGLDIRHEFSKSQQIILKQQGIKGYSVVGDLGQIPFQHDIFDLVWSFSTIQHTHIKRFRECLRMIDDILVEGGFSFLELPNKDGIRNKVGPVKHQEEFKDDFDRWCVRYYSIAEYREIFNTYLSEFDFKIHSFLGIGVLKEDLKYVSWRQKGPVFVSLLLTRLAELIRPMQYYADSIYARAEKKSQPHLNESLESFLQTHHHSEFDNLNIVPLLQCPISGGELKISPDRTQLISPSAGVYYDVIDNIPILVASEAHAM